MKTLLNTRLAERVPGATPCPAGEALEERPPHPKGTVPVRPGFTLVEMLVSVALVLLMMLMFAQIFQLAAGSVSTQKGMAENDQRARTLHVLLRQDLQRRTFKLLVPFGADENLPWLDDKSENRRGYFYVSENNPGNDTDDVLQFTIRVGADEDPVFGRAELLDGGSNMNQPAADDGQIFYNNGNRTLLDPATGESNRTGSSQCAEVSYFLRNGNLYRRVQLIRQPYNRPREAQPRRGDGTELIAGEYEGFWRDFDYSAFFNDAPGIEKVWFHHFQDALDNDGSGSRYTLGDPRYRFGHFNSDAPGWYGQPREFIGDTFIGRFTHEETSHLSFGYPGQNTGQNGHPFDPETDLTVDSDGDWVVDQYRGGARRGEDLLLSHVHAFDVKLWDEQLGEFRDVGHGTPAGDFSQNRNNQPGYGPNGPAGNRVFDTWHPEIDWNDNGAPDQPPFRPLRHYPAQTGGDTPVWTSGDYSVNEFVFPENAPYQNDPHALVYRSIQPGQSGPSEPLWPDQPRRRVIDGSVIWEAVGNLRPVGAIQITIRYYDVSSDQMRQVTLVQSLTHSD